MVRTILRVVASVSRVAGLALPTETMAPRVPAEATAVPMAAVAAEAIPEVVTPVVAATVAGTTKRFLSRVNW